MVCCHRRLHRFAILISVTNQSIPMKICIASLLLLSFEVWSNQSKLLSSCSQYSILMKLLMLLNIVSILSLSRQWLTYCLTNTIRMMMMNELRVLHYYVQSLPRRRIIVVVFSYSSGLQWLLMHSVYRYVRMYHHIQCDHSLRLLARTKNPITYSKRVLKKEEEEKRRDYSDHYSVVWIRLNGRRRRRRQFRLSLCASMMMLLLFFSISVSLPNIFGMDWIMGSVVVDVAVAVPIPVLKNQHQQQHCP